MSSSTPPIFPIEDMTAIIPADSKKAFDIRKVNYEDLNRC